MLRCAGALTLVVLALGVGRPSAAAPLNQGRTAPAGSLQMGLAHVDLMDLHLARRPDGPPIRQVILDDDQIARRYDQARAAGAGWNRWTLYRDLVETGTPYDWTVPDGIVGRDRAHGLRTLMILQSQAENIEAPIFLASGGGKTDDPAQATAVNDEHVWARFVAAAVERYGSSGSLGGVVAWEIGNEPNIHPYWRDRPEDYARFLEVAYLVIKRADPTAIVIHGSIADDVLAEAWFTRFLDALRSLAATGLPPHPERYGYYFDRSAWHWYRSPAHLQTGPGRVRAILRERGMPAKPVWVTETGVPVWNEHPGPCWDATSPGRATLVEQAGFVWQTAAEAFASGVELLIHFQLADDCGNGPKSYDAFGLVRNPANHSCWDQPGDHGCWRAEPALAGQPRPAYQAYQLAAQLLAGARFRRQAPDAGTGFRLIVFERGAQRISVVWSTGGARTARLPAATRRATRYTLSESGVGSDTLSAIADGFSVDLPAVSNRNGMGGRPIMAGVPIILVEDGVNPGAADGASAAPSGSGSAVEGSPDPAVLAADREPPVLAAVEPLPETSEAGSLRLSVIAGDAGSGLAAWILYAAEGEIPPREPEAWEPVGGVRPWTAAPGAGQVGAAFLVQAGRRYHFAAQAADRAGNWTALPPYSQASTRIGGGDSLSPASRAVPAPVRSATENVASSARPPRRPRFVAE